MIRHDEIEFSTVKHLMDLTKNGKNLAPILSGEYPKLESDVAILAIQEQQLIIIANKFRLEHKLQLEIGKKRISQKLAREIVNEAYKELDKDSKF